MFARPHLSRSHVLAGIAAAVAVGPRVIGAQTLERIRFGGVPTDDMIRFSRSDAFPLAWRRMVIEYARRPPGPDKTDAAH